MELLPLAWASDAEACNQILIHWLLMFFRIVRAEVADAAMYTCMASNRAGVDNKLYSLRVLGRSWNVPGSLLLDKCSLLLVVKEILAQI